MSGTRVVNSSPLSRLVSRLARAAVSGADSPLSDLDAQEFYGWGLTRTPNELSVATQDRIARGVATFVTPHCVGHSFSLSHPRAAKGAKA